MLSLLTGGCCWIRLGGDVWFRCLPGSCCQAVAGSLVTGWLSVVADAFWSARFQAGPALGGQAQGPAAQASICSFSGSCLWGKTCCLGSCRDCWRLLRRIRCCWYMAQSKAVTSVRGMCRDAHWLRVDGCHTPSAGCRSLGAALGQVWRGGLSSGPPASIHAQVGLLCKHVLT